MFHTKANDSSKFLHEVHIILRFNKALQKKIQGEKNVAKLYKVTIELINNKSKINLLVVNEFGYG